MTTDQGVRLTWLGHAATTIETPSGKTIVIDPWIQGNPAVPADQKQIEKLDLMLITHGHFDHLGDAVAIAQQTQPDVIAIFEICHYLESKGIQNCQGMNKGGTIRWNDIDITMVNAIHSSGITEGDQILYGGTPAGFIMRFSDGFTVYHAGDTEVFSSMRLIGNRYHPDLALLPIGGYYTMDPVGAAEALRLLGVQRVIPIHYATFPLLKGTPDELRQAASDIPQLQVIALRPGESITQNEVL